MKNEFIFSVIVPTYNRISLLKETLRSLLELDHPNFEIIVVDDGSTDDTAACLAALAREEKIRYFSQRNQGPAIARNLGLENSRGEYIAFTDDDCIVPTDWLLKFSNHLVARTADGVGGKSRTGDPTNPFSVANDGIGNFLKDALSKSDGAVPYLTSNNAAYSKEILMKVGGFDRGFTIGAEERDLNHRIVRSGGKLVYDPTIVINHYNNARLLGFVRHQFDQGKGSYIYYRNSMENFGQRPAMIPPKTYLGLLLHPFGLMSVFKAIVQSGLIILAQVAVTIGYLTRAVTDKK